MSATRARADAERRLRTELLDVQYRLRDAPLAAVVLVSGPDHDGVIDVVNALNEWLDARLVDTRDVPGSPARQRRPFLQRWFEDVPARGRIALFPFGWPQEALAERFADGAKKGAKKKRVERFERRLRQIREFERTLVDGGHVLVKAWLHVPDRELKRRRKGRARDPLASWFADARVGRMLARLEHDDAVERALLAGTQAQSARWRILGRRGGAREKHAQSVALLLRDALRDALAKPRRLPAASAAAARDRVSNVPARPRHEDRLGALDLTARLPADLDYEAALERLQGRLNLAVRRANRHGLPIVLAFEGPDAAGKGGAIRRLTRGIRAPVWRVVPVSAPAPEEAARHWLWRFWGALPRPGHVTLFDRSWYGRVLVERVEGFATPAEWRRAYREIVEFERQLVEDGVLVRKYWVHVSPEEQLARFEARRDVPFKKYKLTPEDYRNRAKRPAYEVAANEAFARTDSPRAPWRLIAGDDKRKARLEILEDVARAVEDALG